MIHQFRILYPQGSLISELIKIDCGKYLVKASIQVDGITLTTGLAAADTIELAEDRARQRALEAIALDAIVGQETKQSSSLTTEKSIAESEKEIVETISSSTPSEAIEAIETKEETPVTPVAKKTKKEKKKSTDREPISLQDEPSSNLNTVNLEPEPITEKEIEKGNRDREDLVKSWFPEQNDIEENVPDSSDRSHTESYLEEPEEIIQEKQGSLFDESISSNFTEEVSVKEPDLSIQDKNQNIEDRDISNSKNDYELESFADVKAQTDVEMKRLGWTITQGRDFLVTTYGKRSREILTINELQEFLKHLQSQPTP
jgi:hypothetical protein